jgi:septum formation protein
MIVLASSSPRRQLLMPLITSDFIVFHPDIDETSINLDCHLLAGELSKQKAAVASKVYPNHIILACDTIVVSDAIILGKPNNQDEAIKMLMSLSNKTHQVISGYTIITPTDSFTDLVVTSVQFKKLTEKQIIDYVNKHQPFDKAGAYGIQDPEFAFVSNLNGSYENVMGFPVNHIRDQLKKMNLIV